MPLRNKFRDSYYDLGLRKAHRHRQQLHRQANDSEEVRADYQKEGLHVRAQSADVNNYIVGFNMLDPVIGWGDTPEQQRDRNRCARRSRSPSTGRSSRKIFPKRPARRR